MTRAKRRNRELHNRQRTEVVSADDQQIGVPAMPSLPTTETGRIRDHVGPLETLRRAMFFFIYILNVFGMIFLVSAVLHKNYLKIQILENAYKAAHAPIMSHPVQVRHYVVQALRTGQYKAFASMLDNVTDSVVRHGVTIFAPTDEALLDFLLKKTLDELEPEDLVRFHIVNGNMPYTNLLRLKVGSRLTTYVPNVTIQVTNATAGSYQVDDAEIVEPDVYTAATIAVHGINGVFNTTKIYEAVEPEPVDGASPEGGLPLTFQGLIFGITYIAVKGIFIVLFLLSSSIRFLNFLTAAI